MLTANYKKLEDENLELRRIIHEMSQTETYLVQNAKLEMKIKRLEEKRYNLIRVTNELNTLRLTAAAAATTTTKSSNGSAVKI